MRILFLVLFAFVGFLGCNKEKEVSVIKDQVNQYIKAYEDNYQLSGALSIYKANEVIYEEGFGYLNREKKIKVNPNSIFQVASITKHVVASAMLKLVEGGKLKLHDSVSEIIPKYHINPGITIEHLLAHTSGIPNFTKFVEDIDSSILSNPDSIINYICEKPLDFEPGTKYQYSNTGYILLGEIIKAVTNLNYEEYISTQIFTPIGLKHSGFEESTWSKDLIAIPYTLSDSGKVIQVKYDKLIYSYASGAMYSSVSDLMKWNQALWNEKFISKRILDEMMQVRKEKYGLGCNIDKILGKTFYGHGGASVGLRHFVSYFPELDVHIVLLTNQDFTNYNQIIRDVVAIILDKPYEVPKKKNEIELSNQVLQKYVGSFKLSDDVIFDIEIEEKHLLIKVKGRTPLAFYPMTESLFFSKLRDVEIQFMLDEKGVCDEFILMQDHREVTVKRVE